MLDAAHTKEYFDLLALPKNSLFNKALPSTVRIEDKPGALDAVRCDAGIVVFMSMPAQNTRSPAPVSTAERISASAAMLRHASASWRSVGGSSAFACAGRSIVTTATCGWSVGNSRWAGIDEEEHRSGAPGRIPFPWARD